MRESHPVHQEKLGRREGLKKEAAVATAEKEEMQEQFSSVDGSMVRCVLRGWGICYY